MLAEMLDEFSAAAYLVERGVFAPDESVRVSTLRGGVSNVVLAAASPSRAVVLKQSLARLRVADEWLATRDRVVTEARALARAREITPDAVPRVVDHDPAAYTVTIEKAPEDWADWKLRLLEGDVALDVAAALGSILAAWHSATVNDEPIGESEAFEQLRVDPFYRTVMVRVPEARTAVAGHLEAMLAQSLCMVHGDFTPKNVLVGGDQPWVVDFEVTHRGDPSFDVASMLGHLLLKAIHVPGARQQLGSAANEFWSAYRGGVDPALTAPDSHVLAQVGCLLLARVAGKSPAPYLTDDGAATAFAVGLEMVRRPQGSFENLWATLLDGCGR